MAPVLAALNRPPVRTEAPMKPAVFLDRDGTVIEERGYLGRLDLIELLPGSAEAIRLLKAAGYAVVIVTNQAGIARGLFDEAFVQSAHARLDAMLREAGAVVDGYYYCPHHPDGVVDRYRLVCGCRKPAPGMVRQAAAALDLDLGAVVRRWRQVARHRPRAQRRRNAACWCAPATPAGTKPCRRQDVNPP